MKEMQIISKTLEKHFSTNWIRFDFTLIMPERIAYMLIRDVNNDENPDLTRSYRRGDIVYLFPSFDWHIITKSIIKHQIYLDPFDFYLLPEDALLELGFDN